MKNLILHSLLLATLLIAACGDPAADAPAATTQQVQAAVAAAVPAQAPTVTPPSGVSTKTVDACALLAESDAIAILGTLSQPPLAKAPQGSLLGGCEYAGAKGSGSVSAHPADELKGTVEYMGKDKPVRRIEGLGEAAYATDYGVMVQPAGKPYFLSVFIVGDQGPVLTEALARKLKL